MLINRAALILKATQKAVDWINDVDPYERGEPITLAQVREDCLVYLVPEDVESAVHAKVWALNNAEILLEEFMHGWFQDDSLWPKKYGPKLFEKWFTVEYHSMVIDTVDEPVLKDEM
jgi:hypothetical protein